MKIGYSWWGFLSDVKMDEDGNSLSTPDGNATYGGYLIAAMQDRGHTVFAMQEDRDLPAYERFGYDIFSAFSRTRRLWAHEDLQDTRGINLPELDILLLEWRFPIPGRNCESVSEDGTVVFGDEPLTLQPDLIRQTELLRVYGARGTPIVIWDLDHKLTERDERGWPIKGVLETSVAPRRLFLPRTRVEPPCHVPDLLQHPLLPVDRKKMVSYVGSRYERDDIITQWIGPAARRHPEHVHFYGNWLKTIDECRSLWPGVEFHDRITTREFRGAYGDAGCVPLLAKEGYRETGFVTPRVWEALLFGSIPVGLAGHLGVENYVSHIAKDGDDFSLVAETLTADVDIENRRRIRRELVERLEFMDASNFVKKLEEFT